MRKKMFDLEDLKDKKSWLEALAGWSEWEYPISYQRNIDGVIHLLNEMIIKELLNKAKEGD